METHVNRTHMPSAGCGCLIGCGGMLYFCIVVLLAVFCVVYQYFHGAEL